MDANEIVNRMCRMELSAADKKAIGNARGFSSEDTATPEILASSILSDQGLAEVFSGLGRDEIVVLHLLKFLGEPVDVTAFESLSSKRGGWTATFTQQYGDLFKQVKNDLVRKGVLAFATDTSRSSKATKLEKQVFAFPPQMHPFLPSPFSSTAVFPGPGEFDEESIRKKLREIVSPTTEKDGGIYALSVKAGVLHMGKGEFGTDAFQKWQYWKWALGVNRMQDSFRMRKYYADPIDALKYAFSLLGPDEYLEPDELKTVFEVFCGEDKKLDFHEICRQGWETGCLARRRQKDKTWYRTAAAYLEIPEAPRHGDYIRALDKGDIAIDLEKIPLKCLETISRISLLRLEKDRLTASPDIARIGRVLSAIKDDPFVAWLAKTSDSYSEAFRTAENRRGGHIVHKNLMIAKIGDVGLKVALEKEFKGRDMLFLPGGFVAFPEISLRRVESIVAQKGFAVKTVESSDANIEAKKP